MRRFVEQWILREQDSSPAQIYLSLQLQKYNLQLTYFIACPSLAIDDISSLI